MGLRVPKAEIAPLPPSPSRKLTVLAISSAASPAAPISI